MKKFIILILIVFGFANTALANGRGHHGHGHGARHSMAISGGHHGHGHRHWGRHGGGWKWLVPALIGGAVVYAATQPSVVVAQPPVVVQQPPVVVQAPQVAAQKNCSPWTEIENSDGSITRSRTCDR